MCRLYLSWHKHHHLWFLKRSIPLCLLFKTLINFRKKRVGVGRWRCLTPSSIIIKGFSLFFKSDNEKWKFRGNRVLRGAISSSCRHPPKYPVPCPIGPRSMPWGNPFHVPKYPVPSIPQSNPLHAPKNPVPCLKVPRSMPQSTQLNASKYHVPCLELPSATPPNNGPFFYPFRSGLRC